MSTFAWLINQASGMLIGTDALSHSTSESKPTGGAAIDRHSFEFLRTLEPRVHKILTLSALQLGKPQVQADFAADMRDLAEVLVWSDNRNLDDCFALFIEKNVHQVLLNILKHAADFDGIILAVLRFFNVFLESVKSGNIMYFMLSNYYINDIISVPLNKARSYPLFSQATIYHYHQESMVRVGVRTIILNLLNVNDPETLDFIIQDRLYFIGVVDHMAGILQSLCGFMEVKSHADSQEQLGLFLEYLEYLNEIFSLELENASKPLAAAFLERIVVASLMEKLFKGGDSTAVAIFILTRILAGGICYQPLTDFIVELLFSTKPATPKDALSPSDSSFSRASSILSVGSSLDINSNTSARQLLMGNLSLKSDMQHMMLTLALLYTIVTSNVSHNVLDSAKLLSAKVRKTKSIMSSLMDLEDPTDTVGNSTSPVSLQSDTKDMFLECDFKLVDRLVAILAAEEIFTYPLFISQLVCHLIVELVGSSCELPLETNTLIKNSFTQSTTRFKTALDIDASMCMDIYEFETQQTALSLDYIISNGNYLIQSYNQSSLSADSTNLIPLSIAVKTWLLFYDCLCKIGMRRAILPPAFDWASQPVLPNWSVCDIAPCVVQKTENGLTYPPENRYFVECETHFVLAEPLSRKHQQERATTDIAAVCQYMRWPRIQIELVGADLYAVDVLEVQPIFSDTSIQRVTSGLYGFQVIVGSKTTWRGRLVFGANDAQERVRGFIAQQQSAAILAWKRNIEHLLEQLRWRYA
ncbi:hypothetical protein BATDEDRAFT_35767 [Batrachochytrium dendrobatidis JAM81]|uniref:FPL domain-containing protein n=1 Tax=Batrachochytrium dendrobatidis (strain JAM81 / FGSC 10211) TaxID=684364 RepID=F4P975_BATDJ|nr:uncharacterized protein BATDEDRAFT_35767 [Batrachochytrium dendrobatidis JAM81]EGF78131.1 hypothetical protein BATDEDRAFT_35767 [Batrachochytrium dendrobatidis JAM81]|eukprot:XP_006681152.1 hypothetical protein BATDEDRAFT_35767 [Batrachochytrium dendrobatidis JAM81]